MKKILLLMCLLSISQVASAASATRQLGHLLSQYDSLTADFTQQLMTGQGRVAHESHGRVAIKQPNKFRWQTAQPNQQILIARGDTMWVYDVDLEQAFQKKLSSKDYFSPAYLLSHSTRDLPKRFTITASKKVNDQQTFKLVPIKQGGQIRSVSLTFVSRVLSAMDIIDSLGQRIHIIFTNVETNPRLSANVFKLRLPRGVDIIAQK